MRSKTSKSSQNSVSLWKVAPACSELELASLAQSLALEVMAGERVLLEGPMGAGKTTFARALLLGLGIKQPPEGSPSFAIAHEYSTKSGGSVIHADFYRIRDESEIDDAGLSAYFWERKAIVIAEWVSAWPEFEKAVIRSGICWRVQLAFAEGPEFRSIRIEKSLAI